MEQAVGKPVLGWAGRRDGNKARTGIRIFNCTYKKKVGCLCASSSAVQGGGGNHINGSLKEARSSTGL